MTALVRRTSVALEADSSRVLARLFVPGHELLLAAESRTAGVLARIVALPEDDVAEALRDVMARYAGRHRDVAGVLRAHYEQIAHRLPDGATLTAERRSLIGAVFTSEFAIEGAALFNPSVVVHPDQSGLPTGCCRFVLSLRAVGEGHLSCVEFRTGIVGPGQALHLDEPGPWVEAGQARATIYDREPFAARLAEEGADAESASFLVAALAPRFDDHELDSALSALADQRVTRQGSAHTAELARRIARCTYEVRFAAETALAERVLWPRAPVESHGLEDARFVRFVEDDGVVSYRGTYTAFDGEHIAPQLIETDDFRTFRMSQLAGAPAKNKGMALFPRRVRGRQVALSRWDRENTAIAFSDDGRTWEGARTLHAPSATWDLIQTGNCGSPIETEAGWLVLTHGVGPMREYAIGALLLELDDPGTVIGELREPLLRPQDDERDGYVPNVVYSCGSMRHGDQLLLPYGVSDSSVRFAFVDVPALLARLADDGPPSTMRANSSA